MSDIIFLAVSFSLFLLALGIMAIFIMQFLSLPSIPPDTPRNSE